MNELQNNEEELNIQKKKLVITPRTLEEPEDDDEKHLVETFKQFIEKKTYIWDTNEAKSYKFNLPGTEFLEVKKMNFKMFEEYEVIYDESYTTNKLTENQLNEIWEKGQFSVKSRQVDVPFIWQLSAWLHKGRNNIKSSFYYDIKLFIEAFYLLKNRIFYCREHQFFNLQGSLKFLFMGIKEIFGLFFGLPKYSCDYMNKVRYPGGYLGNQAREQYQKNLLADYPDIITSIYYKTCQLIIKKIEFDFDKAWGKEKLMIEHDLTQQNLTPKEVKRKLWDLRIKRLIDAYQKTNKLNDINKNAIINLIKSEQIYQKIEYDYNESIKTAEKRINLEIKEEYPILSQIKEWYGKKFKKRMEIVKKNLEAERDRQLDNELVEFPTSKAMIKSYLTFIKNMDENYKQLLKREEDQRYANLNIHIPYRKPNPVEKYSYNDIRGNNITEYKFKTHYTITITSSYPFWRIAHTIRYIYSVIVHLILFCYNHCWNNSYGLKALYASTIIKNYTVDTLTGEVKPSTEIFTYRSSMNNLFKSISKSRDTFINAQDRGFLGRRLGNVMNLMENYMFRLIFGLIFIGVLYPVFIIVYTIFMFAFTLVAIVVGIIFYIILSCFINVLIYDFWETEYRKCSCLPFVWIILKRFVGQFAFNLLITFVLTVFQVIAGFFMIFFGIFRWLLRSLYDIFTYQIIKCNAKIPKANTPFAWRIAGPGISRKLFSKLEVEDSLLLVKAYLEKLELINYNIQINSKLKDPMTFFENLNKKVFNQFNAHIETPANIWPSISPYTNILEGQIEERYKIYPVISQKVRFTRSDLDLLLEATYDIIRENVKDNPKMDFIWERFGLAPLSWRNLTEKILIETFGSDDVLIDVDDSELKYDPNKKNYNIEGYELYDKLSIGKAKKKAFKKMKKFNLFLEGKSSLLDDEDDYYHGRNYNQYKFNQKYYELVPDVPQFQTNSVFQENHHFNIVIKESYFSDIDRFNREFADDERLEYDEK